MTGSVYKRCSACGRNVSGRSCDHCDSTSYQWAYRVYVGKDVNGRWREKRKSGFDTKREAQRALTEVVASLYNGTFVHTRDLTVAEYLRDEWVEATRPPQVRFETWEDRRRNLDYHVIEHIGEIRLQELNAAHINRLHAELLASGGGEGRGASLRRRSDASTQFCERRSMTPSGGACLKPIPSSVPILHQRGRSRLPGQVLSVL